MLLKFVKVNEVVEDVHGLRVSLNIRGLVGFKGLVEMVYLVLGEKVIIFEL